MVQASFRNSEEPLQEGPETARPFCLGLSLGLSTVLGGCGRVARSDAREAFEELTNYHLRRALDHSPAHGGNLAADFDAVGVGNARATVLWCKAHAARAIGFAQRPGKRARKPHGALWVEITQFHIGREAALDRAHTEGNLGPEMLWRHRLDRVTSRDDLAETLRIKECAPDRGRIC